MVDHGIGFLANLSKSDVVISIYVFAGQAVKVVAKGIGHFGVVDPLIHALEYIGDLMITFGIKTGSSGTFFIIEARLDKSFKLLVILRVHLFHRLRLLVVYLVQNESRSVIPVKLSKSCLPGIEVVLTSVVVQKVWNEVLLIDGIL